MSRWNPKLRTVDVVHPQKFFVPGSAESAAPSSVEPRGKTWGIRVRGDTEGTVKHAYRCPVHGEFEAMVSRASVPDEVLCPLDSWSVAGLPDEYATRDLAEEACRARGIGLDEIRFETQRCADTATWAGSTCGIGHAAGEVES